MICVTLLLPPGFGLALFRVQTVAEFVNPGDVEFSFILSIQCSLHLPLFLLRCPHLCIYMTHI